MESTVPGRRERKKQATRRHIASVAIGLFLARGFDEVSVAEIAEAADVSKVTVFNHFPAKAEMVLELADDRAAQPAVAVRDRAPGVGVVDAVRDYYLRALAVHAEWTGLHDGVGPFVEMVWASTTLLRAFAERSADAEQALAAELAADVGEPATSLSPFRMPDQWRVPEAIGHRVAAGMISSVMEQLFTANVARIVTGHTAAEAEPAARAAAEQAFALLAGGLGDYARAGGRA